VHLRERQEVQEMLRATMSALLSARVVDIVGSCVDVFFYSFDCHEPMHVHVRRDLCG